MGISKILIVDDDASSRHMLKKMVESMGFITFQSSNGKKALDIIYDNPDIALLITDIMMPELDGKSLINILRGHEKFARLPIIVVSGVVGVGELNDIMDMGHLRFLQKPVDINILKQFLQVILPSK